MPDAQAWPHQAQNSHDKVEAWLEGSSGVPEGGREGARPTSDKGFGILNI